MPKRTHADALETRRTILQSALNMFSEKGYEKTSLSDIARDAGVTRGAIYWHFEDKGELLYELCLEVTKEKRFPEYILMASKEDEENPLGCIRKWIAMHAADEAQQFFSSALYRILDGIFSGRFGDDKTRERLTDLLSMRMYHISEALQNAVRRNQLPADLNVDLAASFIHTILLGYTESLGIKKFSKPLLSYPHAVDRIVDTLKTMRR